MNVSEFRKARANFEEATPFSPETMDDYRRLWKEMREAARPEHVGKPASEFMSDWVSCSCGWNSEHYWDGLDYAWKDWREHVAGAFGLLPNKCPCGKAYVPADGGEPCHYLTPKGRVLGDEDFKALADEAERGYDVTHLQGKQERER